MAAMALRLASAGRVSSVESLNQAWYTPARAMHMAAIRGQSYRYRSWAASGPSGGPSMKLLVGEECGFVYQKVIKSSKGDIQFYGHWGHWIH